MGVGKLPSTALRPNGDDANGDAPVWIAWAGVLFLTLGLVAIACTPCVDFDLEQLERITRTSQGSVERKQRDSCRPRIRSKGTARYATYRKVQLCMKEDKSTFISQPSRGSEPT